MAVFGQLNRLHANVLLQALVHSSELHYTIQHNSGYPFAHDNVHYFCILTPYVSAFLLTCFLSTADNTVVSSDQDG